MYPRLPKVCPNPNHGIINPRWLLQQEIVFSDTQNRLKPNSTELSVSFFMFEKFKFVDFTGYCLTTGKKTWITKWAIQTQVCLSFYIFSNHIFLLIYFRASSKTEDACELYVRAGNAFKMCKKWAGIHNIYELTN